MKKLLRPDQGFVLVMGPEETRGTPLAAWIRGPLRTMARDLLTGSRLRHWGGLDAARVGEMLESHLRGRQDYGLPLFNLLSIVVFLERRRAVPAR